MDYTDEELDALRRKALTALHHITKGRNWQDWLTVGRYLVTGRDWAMRISNSNAPQGIRYNQALNVWFVRNPQFEKGIGKSERNDLMRVMENQAAVGAYLDGLSPEKRRRLNHPTSVLRAWNRDEADKEREAALRRLEKASAESVKADDGTPLNIPIHPGPGRLQLKNDIDDMRRAMELRKQLGDEGLKRLWHAIGRLLNLTSLRDE